MHFLSKNDAIRGPRRHHESFANLGPLSNRHKVRLSVRGTVRYIKETKSKLESACEIHDTEGVILLLDLTQPLHVLAIHLLQRRPIQRIVGVMRRILQVLSVLEPSFCDRSAQTLHVVVHILVERLVERLVAPRDKDARWEDGVGTVGRVSRWCPVCKNIRLERIKVEDDHSVLVLFVKSVTQCLCHTSMWVTRGGDQRMDNAVAHLNSIDSSFDDWRRILQQRNTITNAASEEEDSLDAHGFETNIYRLRTGIVRLDTNFTKSPSMIALAEFGSLSKSS